MGSTVGAAGAGALSAVSPVMAVYSGLVKGQGDQAAADYQANKLRVAADYARTSAVQTDAQMRENLNVQLGNIDAVRAAANVNPASPTTAAIRDRTEMIGDRSRSTKVGNIMAQAAQDESDATYYNQAGAFALQMGIAGGAAKAASMIASAGKA